MGFSVSGAAALIFLAFLISFGTFYGAASNAVDDVQDAQDDRTDRTVETINTEIDIVAAEYNDTEATLNVTVDNTGASALDLNATDLLVDGEFVDGWEADATLDGSSGSTLWVPQERLNISLDRTGTPERVKLVTEYGVADTASVNTTGGG